MYNKAVKHFQTADPILYQVMKIIEPFELSAVPDPFIRLIRSIIGQQLSVKAAKTIYQRLENLFDKKNITPDGLLKMSDDKLRSAGISYQKISYLKDLASKVVSKEVELNKFKELESEIIMVELVKVKGIGPWTAEMFLMFTLGRPDVFSYGDLGLQNAIKRLYNLRAKPTTKQMEKLSKKWIPYRTYAAMTLWKSLDNEPK